MTIDIQTEDMLSFPQVARKLPPRRNGRPVHVSTIHRWRHPGLRGVRLEAVRIGGAWHTSWQAFQRFCDQLTAVESIGDEHQLTRSSSPKDLREIDSKLDRAEW